MSFLFFSSHTALDDLFQPLSETIHVPTDQLKYFLNALVTIPLCFGLRFLPNNPTLKHAVYASLGLILTYFVFGLELISLLFTTLPVFFIMKFAKSHSAANLCFVLVFGYMLYRHIYLYFYKYLEWSLDFTTVHMIVTLKLTAFAWSVANGASAPKRPLTPFLEAHKITKYPSLFEYYSFILFFPGLFSGPSLEYNDYMSFITMERFKEIGSQLPAIPWFRVVLHFFIGVFSYAIQGVITNYNYFDMIYWVEEHPDECGLFFKFVAIFVTLLFVRFRYYGTWKFTEVLGEISGCGYSGMVDGVAQFDLYRNVDIIAFETSRSAKVNFDVWNTYVQRWLRNYIYEKLIDSPLDSQKTTVTMLVSAFWHGVYPGYYLTFFFLAYDRDSSYMIFKQVDPWMRQRFGEGSVVWNIYDVLLRLYTIWSASYAVVPFMRYEFYGSMVIWGRTLFLGNIIPIAIYYALKFFPIYPQQKRVPKEPTPSSDVKED